MQSITISVDTRSHHYPVHIGRNLQDSVRNAVTGAGGTVAAIVDESFAAAHSGFVEAVFRESPCHIVPSGEQSKCFARLEHCAEFLSANRLDRNSLVFAVGGGVTGDLAGFAAASYLRGVSFIQVPTTLLAMVDSSVGGKTGINLSSGKNLVGAFHQPRAVFADCDLLATLPPREFSAGMAEVIKHALLADQKLFERLEADQRLTPASAELPAIVAENVRIKSRIVGIDEMEFAAKDGRALLNLGHTFGHAIEAATNYREYLHGEAVAIGLVLAMRLSARIGSMGEDAMDQEVRLLKVLTRYGLPVRLRSPVDRSGLHKAMLRDKKFRAGLQKFVLLKRIGMAYTHSDVDWDAVESVWDSVDPAVATDADKEESGL